MIPGLARVEMDEKWVGRGGEEIEMTPRFGDQVTQMDRGSGFSVREAQRGKGLGTERHMQFEMLIHSKGINCIPAQKRPTALMWRIPMEKMQFVSYILWASNKGKGTAMTEALMLMDESQQTVKPGL